MRNVEVETAARATAGRGASAAACRLGLLRSDDSTRVLKGVAEIGGDTALPVTL